MSRPVNLALSQDQHDYLRGFLFPGDGKEAVAILLCSRRDGDRRHRLVVQEVYGIPYDRCPVRTAVNVTWHPDDIVPMLERAHDKNLSIVKVHSHPNGYAAFSRTDDEGDERLLPMVRGWIEADVPHGSAVMLPNGEMFGRVVVDASGAFQPLASISVAGDELLFWYPDSGRGTVPDFAASHAQAFDQGTIERLQKLSIAVIGASGTGSPVIEQFLRLGVGELVIVDDDKIEDRNINRILNSTMDDAAKERLKVDVIGDAIERTGLGTTVIKLPLNLWNPNVVRAVAQCDVVFGCMDTIDGRYLLNTLSTYYNIPYFDIGVRLDAVRDGAQRGRIREVCGTIHYLKPGRSSLISRDLFSMKDVAAAGLRRNDPNAFRQQMQDGYIRGIAGHRPAVISVNMLAACLAVNEFLARLHPYREEPNTEFASVTFSLGSMELFADPDEGICPILGAKVGLGDTTPLLELIELSKRKGT
jgi:proteasome lid subunit RPN8/RPN11